MKIVLLEGKTGPLSVAVKKTRRRSLSVTVRSGGAVTLYVPYFVTYRRAESFLKEKSRWIFKKHTELASQPPSFLHQGSPSEFQELRIRAHTVISDRVREWQAFYGVVPEKIVVRHTKSRWGSCSARGTLSFSYRLMLLPAKLRDYVIVHELCHLREFNHSADFWRLVEQTFPDYRTLRSELKVFR